MKLLGLGIAVACQICAFGPLAICQENTTQTQRDLSSKKSASILQLRGNVEARTITCAPSGAGDRVICEGSMVLHADSVDFNETTGEIAARR